MFLRCLTAHKLDIGSVELLWTGTLMDIMTSIIRSLVVTQTVQRMKVVPQIQISEVSV
jgi:hypothetical protein